MASGNFHCQARMHRKIRMFAASLCLFTLSGLQAQVHNWTKLNTGYYLANGVSRFSVTPNCVYVFNTNFSALIRSTNQGLSWDSLYVPSDSTDHEYMDMCFVNDSVGYITGHEGSHHGTSSTETSIVKKTTDRGQTWQTMRTGITDNSMLLHINFFDTNNGMVFGTGNFATHCFKTTNGAGNWTYFQDNPAPAAQIAMPQVNYSSFTGTHAFISGVGVSANGRIARSHDGGQSWSTVQINSSHPSGMRFFNGNDGIVVVNDSILVTNNGATSFSARHKFPYTTNTRSFDMLDMQRGFFCSPTNIYYTSDAGATWALSYSGTVQIESIRISGDHVYASTFNDSTVLKLNISNLASVNENTWDVKPVIFPNPAKDLVHITLPGNTQATQAYMTDALGRLVMTETLAGSQILDLKGLSQGLYLLTLSTSSAQRYTVKLIITER